MSKLVDQFRMTDDSGSEKKEIVFNLGDLTAREWAHSAKEKSAEAERVANEAKEIAENAKQEVKEIAENAAEEVAGAKAVEVTGVIDGRIQWTDNWYVNLVISSLEYVGIRDYHDITNMSFFKRTGNNPRWELVVREGSFSDSFELMDGFNEFNVRGGQFVFRMLVELDALNRLEEHICGVFFKLNDNVVRMYEKNPVITNAKSIGVNKSSIDLAESNLTTLMELVYQIVIPDTPYGIIYKEASSDIIKKIDTGLQENTDMFSSGDITHIYKCDCSNVQNFSGIFVDGTPDYGKNRKTEVITLCNFVPGSNGLSHFLYKLRTLKELSFVGHINTSGCSDFTCAFSSIGCEKLDLTQLDFSNAWSLRYTFSDNYKMMELKLPSGMARGMRVDALGAFTRFGGEELNINFGDNAKITNANNMFYGCEALKKLTISGASFAEASNDSILYSCSNLADFSGFYNVKQSLYIYSAKSLTHESALNCIAGLYDLTEGGTVTGYTPQTLTFHPDVKAQLTEEEIAEATAKGWNIA